MPDASAPQTFALERAKLVSAYLTAIALVVLGFVLAYFVRGDKNALVPWWAGGGAVLAALVLLSRTGLIFFPPVAEVREDGVKMKVFKYMGLAVDEFTVPMDKIASLSKLEGMLFSSVVVENSGGDRDLTLVGMRRRDARRFMAVVEDLRRVALARPTEIPPHAPKA
jgi:hypothetical protein